MNSAQAVVTITGVSDRSITHKIKGGTYSYVRDNLTGCGMHARGVLSMQSGALVPITCKRNGCKSQ